MHDFSHLDNGVLNKNTFQLINTYFDKSFFDLITLPAVQNYIFPLKVFTKIVANHAI